jgi:hypothetical protein
MILVGVFTCHDWNPRPSIQIQYAWNIDWFLKSIPINDNRSLPAPSSRMQGQAITNGYSGVSRANVLFFSEAES